MPNKDDAPLEKTLQLYGTGFTGRFSDRLARRYVSLLAVSLGLTVRADEYIKSDTEPLKKYTSTHMGKTV